MESEGIKSKSKESAKESGSVRVTKVWGVCGELAEEHTGQRGKDAAAVSRVSQWSAAGFIEQVQVKDSPGVHMRLFSFRDPNDICDDF